MTPANELALVIVLSVVGFFAMLAYLQPSKGTSSMSSNNSALEVIVIAVLSILSFAAILGIISSIMAAVLYLAWNAFMPAVFGLREVTFLQAFALTFLLGAIKGLFSVTINKKDE